MVKIAVYDQQADAVNRILYTLRLRYGYQIAVRGYTDLEEFRVGLLLHWPPDIAVLNITGNMDECIRAAKQIQETYEKIQYIFLMDFNHELGKVFQVNTAACLKQPFQPAKVAGVLERLMSRTKEKYRESLLVKNQSGIEIIPCEEIQNIASCRHTITIYGRESIWKCYGKLDELKERLPWYFLRCHQSWIVNMEKMKELQTSYIEMENADKVPVSRNRLKLVKKFMEDNFDSKI